MGFVECRHSDRYEHYFYAVRSKQSSSKPRFYSIFDNFPRYHAHRIDFHILQKYVYARSGNPTREVLQEIIAALENAKYGLCYSSGLGCVSVITRMLKAGDHLISMGDLYGGVYRIFNEILPDSGVQVDFVDLTDVSVIHKLVKKNTKVSERFLKVNVFVSFCRLKTDALNEGLLYENETETLFYHCRMEKLWVK